MKGKVVYITAILMLLIGSSFASALTADNSRYENIDEEKEDLNYKLAEIDNNLIKPIDYKLGFTELGKISNNNNVGSSNINSPEIEEFEINKVENEEISVNSQKISFEHNDLILNEPLKKDKITNSLNFDDSITEPPWMECGKGTEEDNFLAFHSEEAQVNCDTGYGYLKLDGSCGWAQWVISHAYCWFKGKYVCTQTGDYYVQFDIDYNGLVTAVDIPVDFGVGKLEIESNVAYQIAGQGVGKELIFYADSWPWQGTYEVPDEYDEPGPYKIGYSSPITLEAGYSYEFIVQFNIYLDCHAFGFTAIGGGMNLNCWLLDADIRSKDPKCIDLVASPVILINDEMAYTIWTEPFYFKPGDPVVIHATIWNAGIHDAEGFYVAIGLDENYAVSDQSYNCPAGAWPNNALHFTTSPITWPSDTELHSIWCWVDYYNDIPEMKEDNNVGILIHQAQGPPNLKVDDITLIKSSPWPPEDIDWENEPDFEKGDRVTVICLISNTGEGVSIGFTLKVFMDGSEIGSGQFSIAADTYGAVFLTDGDDPPGFNWQDNSCHTFKFEVHDYEYDQHSSKEEEYCPEFTTEGDLEPFDIWYSSQSKDWEQEHVYSEIKKDNPVYFHCAYLWTGDSDCTSHKVEVYLDGSLFMSGTIDNIQPGYGVIICNKDPWYAVKGSHTIELRIDTENDVPETNENNNKYSEYPAVKGSSARPRTTLRQLIDIFDNLAWLQKILSNSFFRKLLSYL